MSYVESYRKRCEQVGWRQAYEEMQRELRTRASLDAKEYNELRDMVANEMANAASATADRLARGLRGRLRGNQTDAAFWEDRYRSTLERCRQLLKRATDAERVVDAARGLHGDVLCRLCGSAYCGGSCAVEVALADYDREQHR